MMKIYHNPRCTKSRQSLAVLENSGHEFEIVKYLETLPTKEELKDLLQLLNFSADQLVRKKEAIWKELYKDKKMSEDDILNAMISHPKLIERPIVIKGNKAVIGRPTERVIELLEE